MPFVSGWQGLLSDLTPAVRLPEFDGSAIVVGHVEHEVQFAFGGGGPGSLDQLRCDAFPARVRGYEKPAHHCKPFARLVQCRLPLWPGPLWVRRREREMAHQLAVVLEDPGADRGMSSQPVNWIVRPVRGIAVCTVDRTQEIDQWLEVSVAAKTDHLLNVPS